MTIITIIEEYLFLLRNCFFEMRWWTFVLPCGVSLELYHIFHWGYQTSTWRYHQAVMSQASTGWGSKRERQDVGCHWYLGLDVANPVGCDGFRVHCEVCWKGDLKDEQSDRLRLFCWTCTLFILHMFLDTLRVISEDIFNSKSLKQNKLWLMLHIHLNKDYIPHQTQTVIFRI